MAHAAKWGVDLMIDLEHQSLGPPVADPTARDARGWCRLELRPDGSLWAVGATWSPDGAVRLREKRQRYVSPAFYSDPKSGRILLLRNVAIVAMPATHKTPALVAASARLTKTLLANGALMDPKVVKAVIEAIKGGDAAAALQLLEDMLAAAAGAAPEAAEDEPGSEPAGDEGATLESVEKPREVAGAEAPPESEDKPEAEAKKTAKALSVVLQALTGQHSLTEQLEALGAWKASHVLLDTERAKNAADREVLERTERRDLLVSLIKCGAEFPSTVWVNPLANGAKTAKARWAKLPLAELRAHAKEQLAARGKKVETPETVVQPDVVWEEAPKHVKLSVAELAICKDTGCDPAVFASLKNIRDGKAGN
jgi:hypothetical protein